MKESWNQRTLWILLLVAFVALVALPARSGGAQNPATGDGTEIATMAIHRGSVSFSPRVEMDEMTLTVAGGGHRSTQSFRGGQTASFAPVDSEGFQLPDGTYQWELVASPRVEDLDLRALKNGKISADGRTFEALEAPIMQRQSGVFTIENGAMVDPNLVEEESGQSSEAMAPSRVAVPPSAAERSVEHNDRDGN